MGDFWSFVFSELIWAVLFEQDLFSAVGFVSEKQVCVPSCQECAGLWVLDSFSLHLISFSLHLMVFGFLLFHIFDAMLLPTIVQLFKSF